MPADQDLAAFRQTFRLDELTVVQSDRWVLSVRPGQITLASMVISSSRGALSFAGLDAVDGADLVALTGRAETAAQEAFGAVRLNLVCLMMKDPIVHFHVLPRYDQAVQRYGQRWEDTDWPGPPTISAASTSDEVLHPLVTDLRSAVPA